MGKIKIKTLGSEEEEKKQKDLAKVKREQKQLRLGQKEEESDAKPEKNVEVPTKDKSVDAVEGEVEVEKKVKTKKSKIKTRGKRYLSAKKAIKKTTKYKLDEAITLISSFEKVGFDESIELHMTTTEGGIKGEVSLPHGTGKTKRVAVVDDTLVAKLEEGVVDFDVLISTPAMMSKLVKFARLLGPKGLMPNPKQGTVTEDTDGAIKKFSSGLVQYKTESKFPLMHLSIGKKSFTDVKLMENIKSLVKSIGKPKIRTMHITSTMSPSVEISVESV